MVGMENQIFDLFDSATDSTTSAGQEEDPVAELARRRFHIRFLYPLQRMAIANVLDAEESPEPIRQLVLFPTGFGKSICFQLPALLAHGLTVVVYPLLALMSDQQHSLERREISSVLIRGAMSDDQWREAERQVETKSTNLVVTNPESLEQPRVQRLLSRRGVFHLAIDEAHCVSEWGETFRPSYLRLKDSIEALDPKVLSAYTATASPAVELAIARHLFGENSYRLVRTDIDKPNISYAVEPTLEPEHTLLRLVSIKPKPLIVFDQSRDEVRLLCELIHRRTEQEVRFYHAGLSRPEKEATEKWFMESEDGILVSTCAYGMGVDKRNIRTVIHYREPPSVEAYIQESGRAGRDGASAEAILIHRPADKAEIASGAPRPSAFSAAALALRVKTPVRKSGTNANTECGSGGQDGNPGLATREQRRLAFLAYARDGTCRRRYLLKLMGQCLDSPCSGCDVCDGTAAGYPEGYREIFTFFDRNRRRFSYPESIRLLSQAEPLSFMQEPPTCAGAGLLSSWHKEDAAALLDSVLAKGIVVEEKKFPWKGKLRLEV